MPSFKDSQEAQFRRVIRQAIRKGPFTKSEREVVLAFFNHWFQHRKSAKGGVVHPGRKRLAKRADVSIATVKRTLDMLRRHGVITATDHLNGLYGNATEYTACTVALTELCAKKKADIRLYGGSNCTGQGRVKMTHRINNVIMFPIQELKTANGGDHE